MILRFRTQKIQHLGKFKRQNKNKTIMRYCPCKNNHVCKQYV